MSWAGLNISLFLDKKYEINTIVYIKFCGVNNMKIMIDTYNDLLPNIFLKWFFIISILTNNKIYIYKRIALFFTIKLKVCIEIFFN